MAVSIETIRQVRGLSFWIVLVMGGAAAIGAGFWLPQPAESGASLPGLLYHGVLSLLLAVAALASGARGLAGDRISGLRDLFGATPLSSAAYFLGRFLGLAVRFTAAAAVLALLGGAALALVPEGPAYIKVTEATQFSAGASEHHQRNIVLLPPDGSPARWIFQGLEEGMGRSTAAAGGVEREGSQGIRFAFRVRHPRGLPIQHTVPIRVEVISGGTALMTEDLTVSLRKEITLPLPPMPPRETEVRLSIRGGHNLIEIGDAGCRLLRGTAAPAEALLAAAGAFLPALLTVLALALLFSSFVSEPSALLAGAVLILLTLAAPALERDLALFASGTGLRGSGTEQVTPEDAGGKGLLLRRVAELAASALGVLPDHTAGGGGRPLSRGECPSRSDMLLPWKETLPRLLAILLLGCLVTSWRRP
jgi:hypothetical protein